MKFNLNLPSGILIPYFLGGATVGAVAGFINAANGNPTAAAIFQILGAVCLLLGVLCLFINAGQAKRKHQAMIAKNETRFIVILLGLATVTIAIMAILAESVRF